MRIAFLSSITTMKFKINNFFLIRNFHSCKSTFAFKKNNPFNVHA